MSCPAPFINSADFPPTGGWIPGRVCGNPTPDLQCCLPCEDHNWIYTNAFIRGLRASYWLHVPSLISVTLILLTFALLPSRLSHAHYLSIGLCVSLIILSLAFIVPLATTPEFCYNAITPRDQYSSLSCAWSGALFIAGTLMASVWILLRSLWIHLQLCWGVYNVRKLYWWIQIFGWGVPAVLLAVTMPVTGVSFRLGTMCLPNQKNSYLTYLGWLMAFACLSGLLQLWTTGYCVWIYLRDVIRGAPVSTRPHHGGYTGGGYHKSADAETIGTQGTKAKVTWNRLKRIMKSQWRSIGLCLLLIINSVFYGGIFTEQARLTRRISEGKHDDRIVEWATCLVVNGLDPDACRGIPSILNEKAFLASFAMAGVIGMACSLLLVRKSMLEGWAFILRHGKLPPREDDGAFIIARSDTHQLRGGTNSSNPDKSPVVERFADRHTADESGLHSPGLDGPGMNSPGLQSPIGTVYTAKERRTSSDTSMV
ncbi:uncharacterized protein RCC_06215 [Ramularia collo-cygni]|uniref:G-protein coupled receptors family 2 profile 2 domain-containing protein n=1 Tax=Ramularia collo-cygni TaxID=112498 RepID=A0A2D3V9P6_9PEZI|nr:uncharacterized protein RCC_06215 [Ramularia collo-cygni]CZT20356.1 uncharacterized protein RCC_06215 [Ramularia collo-cygni]